MAFVQPNLYVLSGGGLHITYSTSGFDGKPHFTYTSPTQSLTFTGDQVQVADSVLGSLVSVKIMMTVDTGSTTFTLVVPRVNLNGLGDKVQITTEGITAHHRFSVFPPAMHGQIDTYSVRQLTGTASHVEFLAVQKPQTKVA